MAKGAANSAQMAGLHSTLAKVFDGVLQKYLKSYEALENIPADELEEELVLALVELQEPNPAMLSAISKFLKDNDIGFDSEEVDELGETARRLAERREARKKAGVDLTVVPLVANNAT